LFECLAKFCGNHDCHRKAALVGCISIDESRTGDTCLRGQSPSVSRKGEAQTQILPKLDGAVGKAEDVLLDDEAFEQQMTERLAVWENVGKNTGTATSYSIFPHKINYSIARKRKNTSMSIQKTGLLYCQLTKFHRIRVLDRPHIRTGTLIQVCNFKGSSIGRSEG